MTEKPQIVLTVATDGIVSAETRGVVGSGCLDYISVLEDLLDARTVESAYTADYTRTTVNARNLQEDLDVERA
ncbi:MULTISPECIES: DUF2997 domain-containing protein [Micromonospora]|uniref:DUF2997 domain-containing protein n=1 Tax=Micromonospora profundi TaxID=1420889 RepID=A0AAJ6L5T9_9ACTN|nr:MULTISPECIES: DUF2997 domain-containing protein [Micromonospora]KOX05597.1 hypothetical protein ADK66_24125 [Micromonospora sp. NRRL B-16802]NJC14895.1 hypothetical protein [Micromonospora profundi]WLS46438.1 DUF2997 domain-containing protein [Micromonospora profundi]